MLFKFDFISILMIFITLFVGLVSFLFSKNYLFGDRKYKSFLIRLIFMILFLALSFSSDNLFIFSIFWFSANFLLVTLMIHKSEWQEAYNSGILTLKYVGSGFLFLIFSFLIFYFLTGSTSISEINRFVFVKGPLFYLGISFLSLFIMIQSGLFPFHKWLTSSLNSSTTVSSMMHAGIINGGGFIFIKFAPIFLKQESIMDFMFVIGAISVIIGTTFKLMQSGIKNMLAYSTISQTGYMIVQCGIGAFAPAMVHLMMHAIFKANLFLESPSSMKEKIIQNKSVNIFKIFISICFGIILTSFFLYGFIGFSHIAINASLLILFIFFIFASQFSLTILQNYKSIFIRVVSFLVGIFFAFLYGKIISSFHQNLENSLHNEIKLKLIHILFMIFLFVGWICTVMRKNFRSSRIINFLYINLLNLSQPHPSTITKNRNSYNF